MAPVPCARICRSSCFMHAQTPRRLIASTRSKLSAGSSAASLGGIMMPALLNAMSSQPKLATRVRDEDGDLLFIGYVAGHAERRMAGGGQAVGCSAERVLVDVAS